MTRRSYDECALFSPVIEAIQGHRGDRRDAHSPPIFNRHIIGVPG